VHNPADAATPNKPFLILSYYLTTMHSLWEIEQRAPALGAKIWCLSVYQKTKMMMMTGSMPQNGKLPVLYLLTGQKSAFSPHRGDSLHRFRSNLAGPTGTWVRLAVQNFTSIGAGGGNSAPKIPKISTFW